MVSSAAGIYESCEPNIRIDPVHAKNPRIAMPCKIEFLEIDELVVAPKPAPRDTDSTINKAYMKRTKSAERTPMTRTTS